MKISILGAGAFGTALGGILADNGYDIDYYDTKLERERLADNLDSAKYIILCVPSAAAPYLLPHLPTNIPLIVATKGLLDNHLFKDFKDYMILSGPGFATDIKAKKETYLTATDQRIINLFKADFLHFDTTTDKKGVLMCGSLKNIYAIYAGHQALQKHTKPWQEYINSAASEMKQILKANGANPNTVNLYCGVGDLELTCDTPSRNYEYGTKLRKDSNIKPDKTVEGFTALAKIKRGELIIPDSATIIKKIEEIIPCH